MNAALLSVGDELILGQTVDTNAAWLAAELAGLGLTVGTHVTVGDDRPAIAAELRRLAAAAEVVIVTGGLGPTEDDLTRQALADALGVELVQHAEALAQMEAFFARIKRAMVPANRVQAQLPVGSTMLANPVGTACGIAAQLDGAWVFVLPGVPREMKRMFADSLRPRLAKLAGSKGGQPLYTRRLHVFGVGESNAAEMLGPVMARGRNPLVNSTVAHGVITLRLNIRAGSADEAAALAVPVEDEIRARLGSLVFGRDDDTMAAVVGRLLAGARATVATAESCTGGWLAKTLTDVPGASDYVRGGWITYANDAKTGWLGVPAALIEQDGAVSAAVVEAMAAGARRQAAADYALALSGVAGPTGGTADKPVGLVYLALADGDAVTTRRLDLPGDRDQVRWRAVLFALDLLRRRLLGVD